MRILKVLLLRALGFQGEDGEPGLYLAGDQRGRFLVIEIHGVYQDEQSASTASLNLHLRRVDERNRFGPDSKAA